MSSRQTEERDGETRGRVTSNRREIPLIFRRAAIISPPHSGTETAGSLRRCLSLFYFLFHFSRLWFSARTYEKICGGSKSSRKYLLAIRQEKGGRGLHHIIRKPSRVKNVLLTHFVSDLRSLKASDSNCIEENKRRCFFDDF